DWSSDVCSSDLKGLWFLFISVTYYTLFSCILKAFSFLPPRKDPFCKRNAPQQAAGHPILPYVRLCFYNISGLQTCFEIQSILKGRLRNRGQRFLCEESLMGGNHHIRERQKPRRCGVFQNLVGTILENIRGFFLIYIQAYAEKFACPDSLDQILCLYQA